MAKEIKITILEDGTISMDTNGIDKEIHADADAFKAELIKLSGGPSQTTHKTGKAGHVHNHDHDHVHVGEDHTH